MIFDLTPTRPTPPKLLLTMTSKLRWIEIKSDVSDFVVRCLTYQRVKIEHDKPATYFNSYQSLWEMRACHQGFHC